MANQFRVSSPLETNLIYSSYLFLFYVNRFYRGKLIFRFDHQRVHSPHYKRLRKPATDKVLIEAKCVFRSKSYFKSNGNSFGSFSQLNSWKMDGFYQQKCGNYVSGTGSDGYEWWSLDASSPFVKDFAS